MRGSEPYLVGRSRQRRTEFYRSSGQGPGTRTAAAQPESLFGLDWEWTMTAPASTVRHCPKSCRRAWHEALRRAATSIADDPLNEDRWTMFFALPKLLLRLPSRSRKKPGRNALKPNDWIATLLSRARAGKICAKKPWLPRQRLHPARCRPPAPTSLTSRHPWLAT